MTEVEVYRFSRSLLDWEGVHVVGEDREGQGVKVLLSSDDGMREWCTTLQACEAFRAKHGMRVG